jgi:LysR family transcriptional activator of nhaA
MDWLNYHHLRYFHAVAKEGGLAAAAKKLRVSQPSISEQVRELEEALGEKLFRREGRRNKLTDAGRIAFDYATQIFALGQELVGSVKQRPGAKLVRLHVGVADSLPKLVTNEILKPVFQLPQEIHVVCREGKLEDLLAQLAAHKLDIVLADEPASSASNFKAFNHPLGEVGAAFCAHGPLARKLKARFPQSLHQAPALLPSENSPFRRALNAWLAEREIVPHVVAEFEDLALMKVMAAEGRGFIALPDVALREAVSHYGFSLVGRAPGCRVRFHAITAERRIIHPAVQAMTEAAKADLFR